MEFKTSAGRIKSREYFQNATDCHVTSTAATAQIAAIAGLGTRSTNGIRIAASTRQTPISVS